MDELGFSNFCSTSVLEKETETLNTPETLAPPCWLLKMYETQAAGR